MVGTLKEEGRPFSVVLLELFGGIFGERIFEDELLSFDSFYMYTKGLFSYNQLRFLFHSRYLSI